MNNATIGQRIWTPEMIIQAIQSDARAGHELSYGKAESRAAALVRAAERLFGSWANAVTASGFDYEAIRRYRHWTREKVIAGIRRWQARGADLSWHHVSTSLDPPLAAAALHAGRFAGWNEALRAAGVDPDEVMRYQRWDLAQVQDRLQELVAHDHPVDRAHLADTHPALLAAIYRHGHGVVAERNTVVNRLATATA